MKSVYYLYRGLIFIIFSGLASCASADDDTVDLLIQNITVHNGGDESSYIADVAIKEGLIFDIITGGASDYKAASVINGEGKHLSAGLWDSHVHLRSADEAKNGLLLQNFLQKGITGLLDMGGYSERHIKLKEEIALNETVFPIVSLPHRMLNGDSFAPFQTAIKTEQNVVEQINALAAEGASFIKIHRALQPDLLSSVVKSAANNDLTVTGHIPIGLHPLDACQIGMQSIQHLGSFFEAYISVAPEGSKDFESAFNYFMSEDSAPLYKCLVDNHVSVTPTLGIYYRRARRLSKGAELSEQFVQFLERNNEVVKRFHDHGVILLAGTDSTDYTGDMKGNEGDFLLDELEYLEAAGIPPNDVIRIATQNALRITRGQGEKTSIVVGTEANLIILNEDPALSASAFRHIQHVIRMGRLVSQRASNN